MPIYAFVDAFKSVGANPDKRSNFMSSVIKPTEWERMISGKFYNSSGPDLEKNTCTGFTAARNSIKSVTNALKRNSARSKN